MVNRDLRQTRMANHHHLLTSKIRLGHSNHAVSVNYISCIWLRSDWYLNTFLLPPRCLNRPVRAGHWGRVEVVSLL